MLRGDDAQTRGLLWRQVIFQTKLSQKTGMLLRHIALENAINDDLFHSTMQTRALALLVLWFVVKKGTAEAR